MAELWALFVLLGLRHLFRGGETRVARAGGRAGSGRAAGHQADQDARAELRHRREHRPADCPGGGAATGRRRHRGRARARVADAGVAAGGAACRGGGDRPGARRRTAGDGSGARAGVRWAAGGRPGRCDEAHSGARPGADHAGREPSLQHRCSSRPAPVGHAALAAARPRHGPGRGRRPDGRGARLQDLWSAVGEDCLVRGGPPCGAGGPRGVLASPERRLRAGGVYPPRTAVHHRDPQAGVRGDRRCFRAAPQDAAGCPRGLGGVGCGGRTGTACR